MKVAYRKLSKLGGNLGLDEDEVLELLGNAQYPPEEKHQRLVEKWFRQDHEPTWEKLRKAIPQDDIARGSTSSYQSEPTSSMGSASSSITTLTGKHFKR